MLVGEVLYIVYMEPERATYFVNCKIQINNAHHDPAYSEWHMASASCY